MSRQFEVDGVPALYAETSGPLRAGLVFRVGQVDEPFPRRGVTHLVEHLALHHVGLAGHHNGVTTPEFTAFVIEGRDAEVRSFLTDVCASLGDLPLDRLAAEKQILFTEAASRQPAASERLPLWRHGAQDYGLVAFPEFGLRGMTGEDLRAWTAQYFVRQNAVLWIAGPHLPDGLTLELPDGERQSPPPPSSVLPVTPAYFQGPAGFVAWDAVVPREPAAVLFSHLLRRELHRTLRQERGLSYTATTDYSPRADGSAIITALADALPEKHDAVLAGVVEVLARIRCGEFSDAELDAVRAQECADLAHSDAQGGRVFREAVDLLGGRSPVGVDDLIARMLAVTRKDIIRVARTAFASGLLQAPGDTKADDAGYTAVPTGSGHRVAGQAYPSLADPARCRVILGDEGVSVVEDLGFSTVRFDTCVLVLAWPDGARRLIDADGVMVHLEPTMFHELGDAIPALDARIPTGLRADMAPRDPEQIPRPRLRLPTIVQPPQFTPFTPPAAPSRTGRRTFRGTWQSYAVNLAIFLIVGVWTAVRAVGLARHRIDAGGREAGGLPLLLIVLGVCLLRVAWAVRGLLRLRAR